MGRLDGSSWRIRSHGKEQLPDLFCDHEEADSRLFMYASYCSSNTTVSRIVVFSSDMDVIMIACYHCNRLLQNCSEVWIRESHAKKNQFIPIRRIYTTLGEKICRVLPSFHCLTGCDSTGSFSRIGKQKSFKVLSEHIDSLGTLYQLGEKPTLEKKVMAFVTRLNWCVYFMTQSVKYLISIIFDINYFAAKIYREKLPPTHNALILHVCIWMNAHKTLLDLPSPIDNGWILKNGKLEQHLMSQVPAPRKVAEFLLCRCKKNCKTNNCSYSKSNLVYTVR